MGQVAVDLLLEAIKAPDQQLEAGEVNRVVLDTQLRTGESTAAPRGRSDDQPTNWPQPEPKSSDTSKPAT
jgi:hypothetical protein